MPTRSCCIGPRCLATQAQLLDHEKFLERRAIETAKRLIEALRVGRNLSEFVDDPNDLAEARRALELLRSLPAERRRIQSNLDKLLRELRPLIGQKICMIGSTFTGASDIVTTPLNTETPGVAVHANIVRTILSADFFRPASPAASVVVILGAGALVSLLAATRPVVPAALLTALAIGGYLAINALVVFGAWNVWLVVVAPTVAMLASFGMVTGYRQFTEERAKRKIRDMFAHALSPALVDQLLADPTLAELGGQRRALSCMFSDIAGFTPLSERLGPHDTVRLLNRYFDRMTDAIQTRGGGYLNKFLGDGILAFFGAPVRQEDHPARSILAAVDCLDEVRRLNEVLARELGSQTRLAIRIGIAAGEAMVGNCGSSERMDYTAIGDCVNLASRLESACKFFGIRILVTAHTWRLAGRSDLLARPLGAVLVAGQARPVEVWNVLGPLNEATDSQREAITRFTRAMELFAGGQYGEARRLLERVAAQLGDDRPTRIFLKLARECAEAAAPDGWQGLDVKANGIVRLEPWSPAAD